MPPLAGEKVKQINNSSILDHLLHCNYLPSFDNSSILAYEKLLQIEDSFLIMSFLIMVSAMSPIMAIVSDT